MRCRKVRSFLLTYCKGELAERQSANVESHLEHCASCRREAGVLRSVFKLLDKTPKLKVSDDFNARLYQRIGQEGFAKTKTKSYFPGRIPRFGTARLAIVATAAVFVLALGIGINFSEELITPDAQQMAVTSYVDNGKADDDLYLTVQPTDNPFLNDHKSVAEMIRQYNRWRQYSQSLRTHTATEPFFFTPGGASMASAQSGVIPIELQRIRIRPVIKNYLIVPGDQKTVDGGGTY